MIDKIFGPLFDAAASVLSWIYALVPNVGVAIVLFTIFMMVLTTPLTIKSTKSMLQMQRVQPQMKALQAKYKNDREALNREMMAFYKENDISPVGGCLPLLAQSPVFIVMYRLIIGLSYRYGGVGAGAGSIIGKTESGAKLTRFIPTDQVFAPLHISNKSKLYEFLTTHNKMNFLGIDLAIRPKDAFDKGLVAFIPFLILLLLTLAIQIYQNRQIQARNPNAQANPQQQMIMRFMPFLLPVFAFTLPAGMAIYWGVQGLCRIGVQQYITQRFYHDKGSPPSTAGGSGTSGPKTGGSKVDPKAKGPKAVTQNAGRGTASQRTGGKKSGASARSAAAKAGGKSSATGNSSRKSGDPRSSGRPRTQGK